MSGHRGGEMRALTGRGEVCRLGQNHDPAVVLRQAWLTWVAGGACPCGWLFSLLLRPPLCRAGLSTPVWEKGRGESGCDQFCFWSSAAPGRELVDGVWSVNMAEVCWLKKLNSLFF